MTKAKCKQMANEVVERNRRTLKEPARKEIAQGWWQELKRDVTKAIEAAARERDA